jgi:hypothetical protein
MATCQCGLWAGGPGPDTRKETAQSAPEKHEHERETNEDPTWVYNARLRPTIPLYGIVWVNDMAVRPRSRTATGAQSPAWTASPILSERRVESHEVETRDRSYLDFEVLEVSMRLSRRVCHSEGGNILPHDHCLVRFFGRFFKFRLVHDEQAW